MSQSYSAARRVVCLKDSSARNLAGETQTQLSIAATRVAVTAMLVAGPVAAVLASAVGFANATARALSLF